MKRLKVSIFDEKLISNYLKSVSVISTIVSLFLSFIDFEQSLKIIFGFCFVGVLIVVFIICYLLANFKNKAKLKINNSIVNIFSGNIFEQKELKVIAFNEYFDTVVDDKIVSSNSLNGKYLREYVFDVEKLNKDIENDERLKERVLCNDIKRKSGKKIKYNLGSIHLNGEYLLLAFTHFDEEDCARLTLQEYVECLMNMWKEIDIIYNGKTVSIPLLGNGITRFKNGEVRPQELLETILWTYRISKVEFTYPACLNIVLTNDVYDKVNLYSLKGEHK